MRFLNSTLLPAMLVAGIMLGGCSTDEIEPGKTNSAVWEGTLAPAPYEKEAVCLLPQGGDLNGRTVKSIELSSSGLYFIEYADNYSPYYRNDFHRVSVKTRDWMPQQSIESGEFTVNGNGEYILNKFGTLSINPDGTVNLKVNSDQTTYIWPVTKLDKIESTPLNERLCRTWELTSARVVFLDNNMKELYSIDVPSSDIRDYYILAVTFTTSGRAYRLDNELEGWYGGDWRWANAANQLVELTSDNENDGEGIFQALFKNEYLEIMNPWSFYDAEDARYEFGDYPGAENIPDATRYAREFINLKAMN